MNKKNMRFCVGGLLLVLAVVFGMPTLDPVASFFSSMVTALLYNHLGVNVAAILLLFLRPIFMVSIFVLGIMLMVKVRPMVRSVYLCVIAGSCLVATLAFTVLALFMPQTYVISYPSLVYSLSLATLALLSLGCHMDALAFAKKLWFVPGIVLALSYILHAIRLWTVTPIPEVFITNILMNLIPEILSVVGVILAGKWMVNPLRKQLAVPYRAPQQPQYPQQNPQPPYANRNWQP